MQRVHRFPSVLALTLLLGACNSKDGQKADTDKAAEKKPADDEQAEKPADDKPADDKPADEQPAEPVRIQPDAIGPLKADTNPDEDLAALFPDYELKKDSFEAEGESYTVYRLLADGEPMLEVQPGDGRVAEATVFDPAILGPEDAHAGATLEELGMKAKLTCAVEAEGNETILCSIDGVSHVQLVFSTEGMEVGPGDEVALDKLGDRKVSGLRWLPKAE